MGNTGVIRPQLNIYNYPYTIPAYGFNIVVSNGGYIVCCLLIKYGVNEGHGGVNRPAGEDWSLENPC